MADLCRMMLFTLFYFFSPKGDKHRRSCSGAYWFGHNLCQKAKINKYINYVDESV